MIDFLEAQVEEDIVEKLKSICTKDIKVEESKPFKRWESKQIWLETYEKEFDYDELLKRSNQGNGKSTK